jgi:hypothetical protein
MLPALRTSAAARTLTRSLAARRRWVATTLVVVVLQAGCGSEDQIRSYTIPKRELLYASNHVSPDRETPRPDTTSTAPTDRLLGAIVSNGPQTWYFKMAGPMRVVGSQEEAFQQFVGSIRFVDEQSQPQWELPPSWRESDSGQQLPTLSVEVDGTQLQVSVIQLGTRSTPDTILDHVNRWRRQMGLPPVPLDDLPAETASIPVAGGTAFLVNLLGQYQSVDMQRPSLRRDPAVSQEDDADAWFRYTAPAGWVEQPPPAFSQLAFAVSDGAETATITVSLLRGDGGGVLANVNRWRQQVGLTPVTEQEVAEAAEEFAIQQTTGQYVEVHGPGAEQEPEAIHGWIGLEQDRSWFIRMRGNARLVADQREGFRAFLQSIQFTGANGSGDGG